MYKNTIEILLAGLGMLALTSCEKVDVRPGKGEVVTTACKEVSICVKCTPFVSMTKSSYEPAEGDDHIVDLNAFVYKDGCLVPESTYYSSAPWPVLRFPDSDSEYNVYFLANVGRQYPPQNESALTEFSFDLDSLGSVSSSGLPMAVSCVGVRPEDLSEVYLVHLVGAFDISFNNVSPVTEYSIRSLCLKNSARDLHPFSAVRATAVNPEGDYLSEDDVAALNAGRSVRLYFTENLQGSLLPDNTDPRNRIPSNLGTRASLCSYIEVVADACTPTADYTGNVYRAYMGGNMEDDFSIVRNLRYELNLDYESDMIKEQEWTVTPGSYVVTGEIKLSADNIPVFASLVSDAISCVDIDVPDGIEYSVTIPSAKGGIEIVSSASSRTEEGETWYDGDGHFVFRSSASMSNTVCGSEPSCDDLQVVVATADGILKKTFTLKHYRSGFPVKFKYESGSIWMKATNPFSQRMQMTLSFTVCKSDGSWSATEYDSGTFVPSAVWTQVSGMPGEVLSLGSSHLPDRCMLCVNLSFPDFPGIDILDPQSSTMPFYIANMPDMIPSKGPSLVRKIGQYSVNRGFDGAILSCPSNTFGPSDRSWHDTFVKSELENVSDASSFVVADKTVISKWDLNDNPTYLHSTDKYVVISSSGMDLGLSYEYGSSWYDFRNIMRLSSDDAIQYPVLAHFGHSLPYEQYEENNRSLTFTVNSQSWWYSFGIDSTWFAEE